MGKRIIYCQKENIKINEIYGVRKTDNIYPAELLRDQNPVHIKYKFKNISDIAKNKCPFCGGNLSQGYEEV